MARDQDANDRTMVERVDPMLGSVLDRRYRIDFRLAAGGFGAIYRATHIKSKHEVALKILHPQLTTDPGVVARFRREGATMTTLRSPHTITAYELGEADDGTLYIVMELLLGESLFERFRSQGRFEWKRMVKISRAICASLAEAHNLGIVHRDLKPTNVHLESKDGDPDFVKVLDFGIAKIMRDSDFDSSDLTNAGQMIGTLDYMSPEQMVGGACTGQSDIYTLGILTYEMIAGVRPFAEAQTPAAALGAILKSTPPPLSKRVPVPEELDRVLARCLERDPLKRYPDVSELAHELDHILGAHDVDEVTRTVAIDERASTTTPMDALAESTMLAMPPPQSPRSNPATTPPPVRAAAAAAPKFATTLPPPEPKPKASEPGPGRTPSPSVAPRSKQPTGRTPSPSVAPRSKPPTGRTPIPSVTPRSKPPTQTPVPTAAAAPTRPKPPTGPTAPPENEPTWSGDSTVARALSEESEAFPWQPTTPLPQIARPPQPMQAPPTVALRRKQPTGASPLPPDSDYATTPVPKFSRAPTTPPVGLPTASPFKSTLPGSQLPPNPNARSTMPPVFGPATPAPPQPSGFPPTPVSGFPQTPSPVGGFPGTPYPQVPSAFPQPVDDGRGSRPVLDLNSFQPKRLPPTPAPVPQYPPAPTGQGFDMAQIQAKDAAVRKMVWIAVLVIAAILGIIFASQL